MLIEHRGNTPRVDPSAYVAPTAVLCGAVQVGPQARILFGAVLTAEDGKVVVGARSVVMENALLRGRARHPCIIGDDVLVGPDFPGTVYGTARGTPARERMSRQADWYAAHLGDRPAG